MINVSNRFLQIGNSVGEMLSGEHCCIFEWICNNVIMLYVDLFLFPPLVRGLVSLCVTAGFTRWSLSWPCINVALGRHFLGLYTAVPGYYYEELALTPVCTFAISRHTEHSRYSRAVCVLTPS